MTKRAAEESAPSLESSRVGPDYFGYYGAQVAELLSQKQRIPHQELEADKKSSTETIGAELSNLKKERLNVLLRQCVRDLNPEIDEMQLRTHSMYRMSQLRNKKRSTSPTNSKSVITEDPAFKEVDEDDMQLLLKSDPGVFKEIVSKQSNDLVAKLNNMQLQLEKLLDNVATTCRPMSRGERRNLQKSIKELPVKNLERIGTIIKNHYATLGKEVSDEVVVNMEEEDNMMLWRLHFYVGAVKSARKLAR